MKPRDYSKWLLQFETKIQAQKARECIEKNSNYQVTRFYNQLGFASKETRDKIHTCLLKKGHVNIIIPAEKYYYKKKEKQDWRRKELWMER